MSSFLRGLGRWVLRLGFGLLAAVAIVSLLVVSLGLLALGLLRALITGQRPQPMMKFKFQNFTAYRGTFRQRAGPAADTSDPSDPPELAPREAVASARGTRRRLGAHNEGVVDVQARDVPDEPRN